MKAKRVSESSVTLFYSKRQHTSSSSSWASQGGRLKSCVRCCSSVWRFPICMLISSIKQHKCHPKSFSMYRTSGLFPQGSSSENMTFFSLNVGRISWLGVRVFKKTLETQKCGRSSPHYLRSYVCWILQPLSSALCFLRYTNVLHHISYTRQHSEPRYNGVDAHVYWQ